ncbi:MAG: Ig-like domain-containing protein [Archangium sp.]
MRSPVLVLAMALSACGPSAILSFDVDRTTARGDGKDPITITAKVTDSSGQPTFGALVEFVVPPPGVLSGVAVSTDVAGAAMTRLTSTEAASLKVTINTAGVEKPVVLPLTFSDPGNTMVTPVKLRFSQSPSTTQVSNLLRPIPTVVIEGANGEKTTSTASVTVSITSGSCAGRLGSTSLFTVAATDGEAAFNGLVADAAGAGCTLTAESTGLETATSSAFDIQ